MLDWHAGDLELWDLHGKKEPLRSRWATVDHAVSDRDGGYDTLDNLFAYCVTCNSSKGRKSVQPSGGRPQASDWDGLSHLFLGLADRYRTRLSAEDKKWQAALVREGVRPDLADLDLVIAWLREAKVWGVQVLNSPPEQG